MARKEIIPEHLFIDEVKNIISRTFITNPNYRYPGKHLINMTTLELRNDVCENAQIVLDKIDQWKHLVNDNRE